MPEVLLFKIGQFLIVFCFTFFISDLRKKINSKPLINKVFIWIMKLSYIIPIVIYGYILATLDDLHIFDYTALIVTILGAVTVIKAKIDLGEYHVWAGYGREKTKLVIEGIYRWVRHPIYVGIFIFIFGSSLTVISHLKWFLLVPFFASLSYIMVFLIIASKKEEAFLRKKFDDKFSRYCKQVHPFLPFQKYDG